MWEKDINIHDVKEIRTRTSVFFGVGAIQKIHDIAKDIKSKGIDKVIVMSGKHAYKSTGAWDVVEAALKENSIGYINFDQVTPNPNTHHVNDAAKMAREFGAKAVISIGGGSPTDAGKSVAILLEYPDKNADDIYEFKFTPTKAAPVISINLTHGTGSETNRFAVVTNLEKNFKPAIAYDCIYPTYAIDDPQLMTKLSPKQTRYVSIDAVNHVVEAATSTVASPYSISLAKEVIELVAKYLPKAIANPEDLEARYFLCYAAMMGGVSFDNGLLHYTHALEHPLSAVKPDLSHGFGLAILLPSVIKTIYKDKAATLADILAPIVPDLKGEASEAEKAANGVYAWLKSVDVPEKLTDIGFAEADVDKLTDLVFTTPSLAGLIDIGPSGNSREVVRAIYEDALKA
ncbi:TPA: alcohol dehydrogenase [Candidatus Gastranaerophilales bacterium HUM_6]|nr:iron-containing alcohol dehydrogenase [bacterium]MEE0495076.1 iron-containing alcohol dehydrogenase [Cyanobacteriota bacterium]CDE92253.1 iron-containing alcohol dehydrogenase [Fusobacterium sp. CAG:815]DAA90302.1 MAG TPA: alcohol dehydrogenase [Candidatus Gastranaerophilales bacterium HUM_6]DAA95184.1 MAG TPA: alcohol dehydrogenase [Candidatus Gastranaerophilales bacterium HUM_7]DAB02590.1 MAG TPA: alcohol dehydrogenase [Candidatus Gastranaerophilales bacterium HUM_12]DAB06346.1 MAG TPA: 